MADHVPPVLVLGIGNELRGDDAAGVVIARRLLTHAIPAGVEVREASGEATGLIDAWEGRDAVVLVDAMRSGATPGTVRRLDASHEPLPTTLRGSASTHALAPGQAIELARALGRLPARVVLYAVEGGDFEAGASRSSAVRAATPDLAESVLREAAELAASRVSATG